MTILHEFISPVGKDYYGDIAWREGALWENTSKSTQITKHNPETFESMGHVNLNATSRDFGLAFDKVSNVWFVGDPWIRGCSVYGQAGGNQLFEWKPTRFVNSMECYDSILYVCSNVWTHIAVWDVSNPTSPVPTKDIQVGKAQGGCVIRGDKLWFGELGEDNAPETYLVECVVAGTEAIRTGRTITIPEGRHPWGMTIDDDGNIWVRTNWRDGTIKIYCFQVDDSESPDESNAPVPDESDGGKTKNIVKKIFEIIAKILGW